ncbi:MAG: hypothetical protein AB1735_03360 [Pseudomonadota bacterium]
MIEIGHRHRGTARVNATAVLMLAYTVGAMFAPVLVGAASNMLSFGRFQNAEGVCISVGVMPPLARAGACRLQTSA